MRQGAVQRRRRLDRIERSFDNTSNRRSSQMNLPPPYPPRFAPAFPLRFRSLAFVDVETTGVDPRVNRITEVGVVTVDGHGVREWSTVINPLTRRKERPVAPHEITDEMRDLAPRFKDIAADLARRLEGRLLVAHNARFDHGFLKAEFDRCRVEFDPRVLCSLMLSRRLYSGLASHDLDSVVSSHALTAPVRHRALHDARLVWQFWQHVHRTLPRMTVVDAIDALLEGPLLPGHLDPSLIDRLPESPGVYVFHGDDDDVLLAATATNLKSRVQRYFRLDSMSRKAAAISHRVRNITWHVTQGPLGASLQLALLPERSLPARRSRAARALHSWQFTPDAVPCISLVPLCGDSLAEGNELYGTYDSERKARNAIRRLASSRRLCHSLLGLSEGCCAAGCDSSSDGGMRCCEPGLAHLGGLTKAYTALSGLRVPTWPYPGAVGIRERRDIYVFDRWQYLGTARNSSELHEVLEARRPKFDVKVFRLLVKSLRRLPANRVVSLASVVSADSVATVRFEENSR